MNTMQTAEKLCAKVALKWAELAEAQAAVRAAKEALRKESAALGAKLRDIRRKASTLNCDRMAAAAGWSACHLARLETGAAVFDDRGPLWDPEKVKTYLDALIKNPKAKEAA
jgi:hypothetical protein